MANSLGRRSRACSEGNHKYGRAQYWRGGRDRHRRWWANPFCRDHGPDSARDRRANWKGTMTRAAFRDVAGDSKCAQGKWARIPRDWRHSRRWIRRRRCWSRSLCTSGTTSIRRLRFARRPLYRTLTGPLGHNRVFCRAKPRHTRVTLPYTPSSQAITLRVSRQAKIWPSAFMRASPAPTLHYTRILI